VALLASNISAVGAQEYYPLKIGNTWTYRVTDLKAPPGKVESKKTVIVEVEREETYVKKTADKVGKITGENKVGYILKSTSGGKTTRDLVVRLDDGFYRVHAAGTPISPPLPFFKYGLTNWKCNSTSGNTTIDGSFTIKQEEINVLGAKKLTYLVSFNNGKGGDDRVEIDCWYAEKIGMAKQRVLEKGREIALTLEKFEAGK
jgi:hypothetical protein